MTLLTIHNVSKQFSGVHVIDHLSLNVQEGEFVSILGPSGSGKSTLFHLIGGILSPDEGMIELNGKHINGKEDRSVTCLNPLPFYLGEQFCKMFYLDKNYKEKKIKK